MFVGAWFSQDLPLQARIARIFCLPGIGRAHRFFMLVLGSFTPRAIELYANNKLNSTTNEKDFDLRTIVPMYVGLILL